MKRNSDKMPPPTIQEVKDKLYNTLKAKGPMHYLVLANETPALESIQVYNLIYHDRRLERVPDHAGQFRIIQPDNKTSQSDKAPPQVAKSAKIKPPTSKEILKKVWDPNSPYIDKPRKIIKKTIIERRCPYCNGLLKVD